MLNDITIVRCEAMSHLVRLRGKDTVQTAHCALQIKVNTGCFFSTASGALVVGGVRDISHPIHPIPEIALCVQWSRTNQSVAVCGSLW